MRPLFPKFFIFSVYQSNKPKLENNVNHEGVFEFLKGKGYDIQEVDGCYKGDIEKSMLCYGEVTPLINHFLKMFNQESILLVEEDRLSYLSYTKTGKTERLGRWTEAYDNNEDSYSIINGRKFVVKE